MTRYVDTEPNAHDAQDKPAPSVRTPAGYRPHGGEEVDTGIFAAHGITWGKTAGRLYLPIRVDDEGRQEVQVTRRDDL